MKKKKSNQELPSRATELHLIQAMSERIAALEASIASLQDCIEKMESKMLRTFVMPRSVASVVTEHPNSGINAPRRNDRVRPIDPR